MTELEITQPDEIPKSADAAETIESTEIGEVQDAAEEQALQDATSDPGAHIEETQTFEQAEAVEVAITEAVDNTKQVEVTPVPIPTPEPASEGPDLPPPSPCPDPKDLPPGSGTLAESHETVEMADSIEESGIADRAEVPEGIEFEPAGDNDDGKDEATPINLPGPVTEQEDEDMQLISGPNLDDLPDGSGILEEPHETVEMAEKPEDRGIAEIAEVPEGIGVELAGEDGPIGRDDHPMADPSELSEAKDDDKDEATPINLPGPVPAQVAKGPKEPPPPPDQAVGLNPGVDGNVAEEPTHGPNPVSKDHPGPGGNVASEDDWESPNVNVALDHTGPGGMVAEEPEPGPDPFSPPALDHPGTGGRIAQEPVPDPEPEGNVAEEPTHGPNPLAKDHPGTGGREAQEPDPEPEPGGREAQMPDPAPDPPDREAQKPDPELAPDDNIDENLQPAPDYEDMNPSERSVVEIIGKAIADEEYRGTLLTDARSAIADYTVTEDDQTAMGEMTQEAFDFFAAEVEKRFSQAKETVSEELLSDAHQQLMQQVVHAVWRDLNPGGLAYILAYKIPLKHP